MKKIAILMVLAMVLTMGAAFAATPGDASATAVSHGTYTQTDGTTADVLGGNIYDSDIASVVSTARWAGLFGEVSGTIVLGDNTGMAATDIMYTWAGATGLVVYAVEGAVDWSTVNPSTNATVAGRDYTYLDEASAPNDNFATTFNETHSLDSNLIVADNCMATLTDDDTGAYWWTMALEDTITPKTIWAAEVVDGGHLAYDGATTAEFQMMIPDDSSNEDVTVSTYDMWLELE